MQHELIKYGLKYFYNDAQSIFFPVCVVPGPRKQTMFYSAAPPV